MPCSRSILPIPISSEIVAWCSRARPSIASLEVPVAGKLLRAARHAILTRMHTSELVSISRRILQTCSKFAAASGRAAARSALKPVAARRSCSGTRASTASCAHHAIDLDPTPTELSDGEAVFELLLAPRERTSAFITVRCNSARTSRARAANSLWAFGTRGAACAERSRAPLRSRAPMPYLTGALPLGCRPLYVAVRDAAGSVSLRRNSVVQTRLRTRRDHNRDRDDVARPTIAQGVLRYLAATQANEVDVVGSRTRQNTARERPARRDGATRRGAVRLYYGPSTHAACSSCSRRATSNGPGDVVTTR